MAMFNYLDHLLPGLGHEIQATTSQPPPLLPYSLFHLNSVIVNLSKI